jgi:hypothetical protein
MSTCWHGEEGFCEICYLINGETHLKAVENSNGKKKKNESESSGNNEAEGAGGGTTRKT